MSDLPAGWSWATLDDLQAAEPRAITDGPFGSNLKRSHYTTAGARVVRLQNIGDGTFIDAPAYISLEHFQTLQAHEVRRGDLVLASLGDQLPRACLVPALDSPAIVKADCIRVRIHASVDARWVLYALMSPQIRRYTKDRIHGVGRPRLGLKEIRSLPVPVPPLAEQRRIVEALEHYLSLLAAGQHSLDRAARRLAALYNHVIDHRLSRLDVAEATLESVLVKPLANGRSVPTLPGGFPVLRLTALKAGAVDLTERKCGAWTAEDAAAYVVQRGDFLVSRGNGSLALLGRGGLVEVDPDPVAFPDTLIRVRTDKNLVSPSYLSLIWRSRRVRSQIEAAARTTAGIHKINQQGLRSVRFPLPPLADQAALVGEVQEHARGTEKLDREVAKTERRAESLRRALLARAFSGRLVPQNPSDEPASALLDRLNADRAAVPDPTRRRARTG